MPKKSEPAPAETDTVADDNAVETVEMSWRGATFTFPRDMDDWETVTCIAVSDASRSRDLKDMRVAMQLVLGDEQFAKLGTKRRDLIEFSIAFAEFVDESCV